VDRIADRSPFAATGAAELQTLVGSPRELAIVRLVLDGATIQVATATAKAPRNWGSYLAQRLWRLAAGQLGVRASRRYDEPPRPPHIAPSWPVRPTRRVISNP
jgi:hypothetical protein